MVQDLKSIEERVNKVLADVKEIIDDVIIIRKNSQENKEKTAKILERFLSELYDYFRVKSKEAGDNLLAGVSLLKIRK